jgi:hypothetical protein
VMFHPSHQLMPSPLSRRALCLSPPSLEMLANVGVLPRNDNREVIDDGDHGKTTKIICILAVHVWRHCHVLFPIAPVFGFRQLV